MKTKKPNEMTNEELLKNEKTIKSVTYTLSGMLLVLFVLNIFLAFKKGFSALFVVPLALLPIVIINLNTLKEIKKEQGIRKLS